MAATSIEWVRGDDGSADHSINPIRARKLNSSAGGFEIGSKSVGHYCEKISPGCAHCYASALQSRFKTPAFPGVAREGDTVPLDGALRTGVTPYLDETKLDEVLRRRKPTRYFWCDMTDLFGWWVRDEWLDKCFAAMAATPQHTHLVLTKRPDRMLSYMQGVRSKTEGGFAKRGVALAAWAREHWPADALAALMESSEAGWWEWLDMPNVFLGVSAEDQKRADERIPLLLQTPAAVRFVSIEPLLGPVDLRTGVYQWPAVGADLGTTLAGIDWVIIGGESGPHARPCNIEWVRSIVQQCQAAGAACFVKQLGGVPVTSCPECGGTIGRVLGGFANSCGAGHTALINRWMRLRDGKGGDPAEWPEDLLVRQFPAALDGRPRDRVG